MPHTFFDDLELHTRTNTDFRRVLYTGTGLQLVLMCLKPGEEIPLETHETNDQFFRFESGTGKAIVGGSEYVLRDGTSVIVPMGVPHTIVNTSPNEPLTFYTIYAPAHHPDGTVHATLEEALAAEDHD